MQTFPMPSTPTPVSQVEVSPPVWLTAKELARHLAVSLRTIRRWHKAGRLPPPLKLGGTFRWRGDVIAAWLTRGAILSSVEASVD